MKIIRSFIGTVSLRVSSDLAAAQIAPPYLDFMNAIRSRYEFSVMPQLDPKNLAAPRVFIGGKFVDNGTTYPINALFMQTGGDVVQSSDTRIAEVILDDLIVFLDSTFGSKISVADKKKSFASNVVFQLDKQIEDKFEYFKRMRYLVSEAMPTLEPRIFSRIIYSTEANIRTPATAAQLPVDAIENVEFTIDRRVGEDAESRLYYSTAPLRTEEHIELLEKMFATTKRKS
jgi:hypothetical protein